TPARCASTSHRCSSTCVGGRRRARRRSVRFSALWPGPCAPRAGSARRNACPGSAACWDAGATGSPACRGRCRGGRPPAPRPSPPTAGRAGGGRPPMNARDEVLRRVRTALGDRPTPVTVPRDYQTASTVDDVVGLFTDRLHDYGATVVRVDPDRAAEAIA